MKLKMFLAAALFAGVCSAPAVTQPPATGTNANPEAAMAALFGDPAVVKGKGFEIKRSDLDQVVSGARANYAASGQPMPADFEAAILDQLIMIQVLLQTATPADQAAGKLEADQQYTNLLNNFPSPEAFDRQLKAVGMTITDLRAKATQEAVAKAALKRSLNINVTDADAKDFYNQHPGDVEQPELAHVRHILLFTIDTATGTPLSTNTIANKRRQIDDLLKQIRGGADFAALAKQSSEDPNSKENGGELPPFARRSKLPPELESAAFALATNQVSDVIVTPFGFDIMKLLDKMPAKKMDYATVAPSIKEALSRQKIGRLAPAFVKNLRAEYQVEILDPSLKELEEKVQAAQEAAAKEPALGAPLAPAPVK